jgi:hypothetical protein
MKKISAICLSGLLLFTACENTGSSSVGTYEKDETSQSSEMSESGSEAHGGKVKEGTEHTTNQSAGIDTTLPTSGDAHRGGSGAEMKTGANVSVDTTNKVKSRP